MKKLIVFLLIPLFLFSGLVSELGKVPALFSHFNDHQRADADLTITDFLAMHYFGDDFDSSDNDEDNSLPFKKHKGVEELPVLLFAIENYNCKPFLKPENNKSPLPKYRDHLSDVFRGNDPHPPRYC